jgi:2-polyprenyl-3-methyl-5-hydroxy-6-metoxy-1,4-benzoquinol methylase
MSIWQHPTGGLPKTVSLVCLGPSRQSHAQAVLEADLSDALDGVDETWTLNRGFGLVPHDLLFVMDHIQGEADKFPRYGAALWKHPRPIVTSDNADGWPDHVRRYPFREIWNWLIDTVNPLHGDWYHNSVAYILCYAAFIGVKELRVFGADYHHHSSGVVEDGHPNVAYWVGKLEAAGLRVRVPPESGFLNANQRGWIYGYRDDPRLIRQARAQFRAMTGQDQDTAADSGERQTGTRLERIQPDHRARYAWAAERLRALEQGLSVTERADLLIGAEPGTQAAYPVYDLGAGIGYGASMLADTLPMALIIAVDRSRDSLDYGEKSGYARANVVAIERSMDGVDGASPCFDCRPGLGATAFELIEHLADPEPLLRTLPVGHLFASVPNEDVVPFSPRTAPFHHRHYTRTEFADLLQRTGWEIVAWHGQTGPLSNVIPWQDDCRTIVVEARRVGAGGAHAP